MCDIWLDHAFGIGDLSEGAEGIDLCHALDGARPMLSVLVESFEHVSDQRTYSSFVDNFFTNE